MIDLIVHGAQVVSDTETFFGGVVVKNGRIVAMGDEALLSDFFSGPLGPREIVDGKGMYLLPGGIDPHVHIRYPGSAHRETFLTGTRAAAAGGVTTVIEHPISSPPQFNPEILQRRIDAVQGGSFVDVAFLGAAGGEHVDQIVELAKCGVVGYKTFLHGAPEGRDEEFEGLTSKNNFELHEVIREVSRTGLKIAAHGEDNDLVAGNIAKLRSQGRTSPIEHANSRLPIVEVMAVERLIRLAELENTPLYLVHISTPQAVELAVAARERGVDITIETCPHYLYLSDQALIKYGSYAKCNPALRAQSLVDKMWDYVIDGSIDTIGSDHAPFTVEEKERHQEDIFVAPSGFPGIETRLGLMLKAVTDKKISLRRAVDLISTNPAKEFGLYPRKGSIRVGADADLLLVDLEREWTVEASRMETMARNTAKVYEGWRLPGYLDSVWLRGTRIVCDGCVHASGKEGQYLRFGEK